MTKPKIVKTCYVSGTFNELPAAHAYQEGRGEGCNIRAAAANAVRDVLKKPALRGRRIRGVKLTFAFGYKAVEGEQ